MNTAADRELDLGLVVPAYNEEQNVSVLVREITETMQAAGLAFELLVVDDGSTDGTVDIVRKLAKSDPRIRALVLTRNFGHQAAISMGLTHVRGNAVGIMDADLQDRPADALALYLECRAASADVAYAVRRPDKRVCSSVPRTTCFIACWVDLLASTSL